MERGGARNTSTFWAPHMAQMAVEGVDAVLLQGWLPWCLDVLRRAEQQLSVANSLLQNGLCPSPWFS